MRYLLYIALFISLTSAWPFTRCKATEIEAHDKCAATLKQLAKYYKQYKFLEVLFTYKQYDKETGDSTTINGTLFLDNAGQRYAVHTDSLEIIANETKIYTIVKDRKEIFVSQLDEEVKALNPYMLIMQDFANSEYKLAQEKVPKNDNQIAIALFSQKPDSPFYKIAVFINEARTALLRVVFNDKASHVYTFTALSERKNVDLNPKIFVFHADNYPEKELVNYDLVK